MESGSPHEYGSASVRAGLTACTPCRTDDRAAPETATPAQTRTPPDRVLLTVEEAAERLHIGKTKTYALVKSGELQSVLIGRLRRIHVDAISDYAARLVANQQSTRSAA